MEKILTGNRVRTPLLLLQFHQFTKQFECIDRWAVFPLLLLQCLTVLVIRNLLYRLN